MFWKLPPQNVSNIIKINSYTSTSSAFDSEFDFGGHGGFWKSPLTFWCTCSASSLESLCLFFQILASHCLLHKFFIVESRMTLYLFHWFLLVKKKHGSFVKAEVPGALDKEKQPINFQNYFCNCLAALCNFINIRKGRTQHDILRPHIQQNPFWSSCFQIFIVGGPSNFHRDTKEFPWNKAENASTLQQKYSTGSCLSTHDR